MCFDCYLLAKFLTFFKLWRKKFGRVTSIEDATECLGPAEMPSQRILSASSILYLKTNKVVYVFGGSTTRKGPKTPGTKEVFKYEMESNTWTQLFSMHQERTETCVVELGEGNILVISAVLLSISYQTKRENYILFMFWGILGSASRAQFPVSLSNHVGFTRRLLYSSTHHSPESFIHLKTGQAQDARLQWSNENWYFHLDISRWLRRKLYSLGFFLYFYTRW